MEVAAYTTTQYQQPNSNEIFSIPDDLVDNISAGKWYTIGWAIGLIYTNVQLGANNTIILSSRTIIKCPSADEVVAFMRGFNVESTMRANRILLCSNKATRKHIICTIM
jgi:hypothetical protein